MSYLLNSRSEPTLQKHVSLDEEQAKIDEVRELLGDLLTEMPWFLSDGTIRRFLHARSWSAVQATRTLQEAVKWRRPSIKSFTSGKEQIKYLVYNLENLTMTAENAPENVVWVIVFRGWTLSSTPLAEAHQSLHIIQNYNPGLVAVVIVSNPPKLFQSFWKINFNLEEIRLGVLRQMQMAMLRLPDS